jgi:hypothetical protein
MTHLDESQFVDLIDGVLPPSRAEHVDECDACRARLAALRATLDAARGDEGHEPSPLFWDHFAARVSAAVRHEEPLPAPPGWTAWLRSPATAWATCASIAVLLMVGALWRATLQAPVFPSVALAPAATPAAAPLADDVEADRAWAVVRTAAGDLAWDDVTAAGITAHPGAAEGVALELTADERTELARLIATEMNDSGPS